MSAKEKTFIMLGLVANVIDCIADDFLNAPKMRVDVIDGEQVLVRTGITDEQKIKIEEICFRTRTVLATAFITWDRGMDRKSLMRVADTVKESAVPVISWADYITLVIETVAEFESHIKDENRARIVSALKKNMTGVQTFLSSYNHGHVICTGAFGVAETYDWIVRAANNPPKKVETKVT